MAITATLDRFEGKMAVLLVGKEETSVNVPRSDLPEGAERGDVLRLEAIIDRGETERRRESIQEKIERLKRRSEQMDEV